MNINRVRLGLMYIFKESSNLSKQTKLQIAKFIEQADEYQLKVLALDGEIVGKDSLDESSKEIIDERFNQIKDKVYSASFQGVKSLLKK